MASHDPMWLRIILQISEGLEGTTFAADLVIHDIIGCSAEINSMLGTGV